MSTLKLNLKSIRSNAVSFAYGFNLNGGGMFVTSPSCLSPEQIEKLRRAFHGKLVFGTCTVSGHDLLCSVSDGAVFSSLRAHMQAYFRQQQLPYKVELMN